MNVDLYINDQYDILYFLFDVAFYIKMYRVYKQKLITLCFK